MVTFVFCGGSQAKPVESAAKRTHRVELLDLSRKLDAVAFTAASILLALEEIIELYNDDPCILRAKQVDKLLCWQS